MMLRSVDCNQPSYRVCFAAVVSCVTNAATVPTYETWGPRVQSLASGASPNAASCILFRFPSDLEASCGAF